MVHPLARLTGGGILVACLAGPAAAQPAPAAPATAPQEVGAEALDLFERVCLVALARREPAAAVAADVLRDHPPVPAERLRSAGGVRETAAWRVRGRAATYSVTLMEPRAQCGVFAEGVAPDAFLAAAQVLMLDPARLLGWVRRGDPRISVQQRPYGTLTYLHAQYVSILPPPAGGDGPTPLPGATVTASAAQRTDGRPDTAVISTSLGD